MVPAPLRVASRGEPGSTRAEAGEQATAGPPPFVAVTQTRRNFPRSAGATEYDAVVAPVPVAFTHAPVPVSDTCHLDA